MDNLRHIIRVVEQKYIPSLGASIQKIVNVFDVMQDDEENNQASDQGEISTQQSSCDVNINLGHERNGFLCAPFSMPEAPIQGTKESTKMNESESWTQHYAVRELSFRPVIRYVRKRV